MTKLHGEEKSQKHRSKSTNFTGKGTVEGRVPIPANDEITIQSARELLEWKTRKESMKPFKCKVIGTDTELILRKKASVGSSSREISFTCNDILRFFIFAKDPRLVILAVRDKPEGAREYLLLKMRDDNQANQVCNVIQIGRKNLLKDTKQEEGKTNFKESGDISREAKEIIDHLSIISEKSSKNDVYVVQEDISPTYARHDKISSRKVSKQSVDTSSHSPMSERGITEHQRAMSSMLPTTDRPPIHSPKARPVSAIAPSKKEFDTAKHLINEILTTELESNQPISTSISSLRSLPRHPLKETRRRIPPVTEEMMVNLPECTRTSPIPTMYKKEDLERELLRDLYDEDWAVDIKIVEGVGRYGSRISENGNVFFFTAHHLVPEPNNHNECSLDTDSSSESDSDDDRSEKGRFSSGFRNPINVRNNRKSHLPLGSQSSSEEELR